MHEALATFAIRLMGAALAFGLQALLARLMAIGDYGAFAMVWTWVLCLASFASLGLAEVAGRLLPRYATRLRTGAILGFFKHGLRRTAAFATACSLAGLLLAFSLPLTSEQRFIIAGVAVALPFVAVEFFLEGIARAMGWFRLTTVAVYIVRPLLIALAVMAFWLAGRSVNALLVCTVLVCCLLASALVLQQIMQRRLQHLAEGRPAFEVKRFWARQSRPMLVSSALDDALSYADVVLVGLLLGPAQSALYFVASRVLTLANLVQYGFYFVAARRFSLSLASSTAAQARKGLWHATVATLVTTALAIVLTLAAAPLLLGIFGAHYAAGSQLVLLLSIAVLARAAALQLGEYMLVAGQTKALIATNAMALVLLGAGFALAAPRWGVEGAAVALGAVMTLRALALTALHMRPAGVRNGKAFAAQLN